MNTYIKLIIAGALLLISTNAVQADNKTNKVAKTREVDARAVKAKQTKKDSVETRKKYAEAVKKIREAVKAGKLTEKQAKEKYAALRKKIAPSRTGSTSRAAIIKRFDKNKDGKLDEKERAEARKSMSSRGKRSEREGKRDSRRGDKRKGKPSRRSRK